MTTVYLIRHSKPLKVENQRNQDSLQQNNEKEILSIEGEEIAKNKFQQAEFHNIDILFSSNYVRAIGTAKYLASKNNLDINVISDLGERKFGFNSWKEKPENFEEKQFYDENYKIGTGESQKEVKERMYHALIEIISKHEGKRIAIVTHSTATMYLLKKWCDISPSSYIFNQTKFFDGGIWKYCQTFKLVFEKEKLMKIEVID